MRQNLCLLLLLMLSVQLMATVKADSTTIEVKDIYLPTEQTVETTKHYTLDLQKDHIDQVGSNSKSVFVTVEGQAGNGEWTLSGREPGAKEADLTYHKIEGVLVNKKPDIVDVSSQSAIWAEVKDSGKLYLTVKNTGAETEPIKLIIVAQISESLNIAAGAHYFVHVSKLKELKLKTKITKAAGNHHYKFMLEELSHHGVPSLSATGVQLLSNGNKGDKKFDFIRFDHSRIGAVIDNKDSNFYCTESSCDYEITANLDNIKTLEVFFGEHIDFELIAEDQSSVS